MADCFDCDHWHCKICGKLFVPNTIYGMKDFSRCAECIKLHGFSEHARQYPMRDELQ